MVSRTEGLPSSGSLRTRSAAFWKAPSKPLTPQQQEKIAQRQADAADASSARTEEVRQEKATQAANRQQEADKDAKAKEWADWMMQRAAARAGRERDDGGRDRD